MKSINLTIILLLFLTVESLSGRTIRRRKYRHPARQRAYGIENSIDVLATKLENHARKIENIELHLAEFSEAYEQQALHLEQLHYQIAELVTEVTKELYREGYDEDSEQTSEGDIEDKLVEENQQNFAEHNEKEVDKLKNGGASEMKEGEIEELGIDETEESESLEDEVDVEISHMEEEHSNSQGAPLIDDEHEYYDGQDHHEETADGEKEENSLEFNEVPEYHSYPSHREGDDDLLPNHKAKLISDDM